jgi:hypothetical protein
MGAEEEMLKSPAFGATTPNEVQLTTKEQLANSMTDVHLNAKPQPFYFNEEFKYFHYISSFVDNGHTRAFYDFQVMSHHWDYFMITLNSNNSCTMKTCVSPIFLNIMSMAGLELNRVHPDISAILAGMHKMTNILVLEVWADFKQVWSNGNVYPLSFKCFPNAHMQLLWHQGCIKLHNGTRSSYNINPNKTDRSKTSFLLFGWKL